MHPDTVELLSYRDGELPARKRRGVTAHLKQCRACRGEAARLEAEFNAFLAAEAGPALDREALERVAVRVLEAGHAWDTLRPREAAPSLSSFVLWGTAIHMAAGGGAWCAWLLTGNFVWMTTFFHYPGALFLLELTAIALRMSLAAWRRAPSGSPRRAAWLLVTAAAACQLTGSLFTQVLSADMIVNPLARLPGFWVAEWSAALRASGIWMTGPVAVALLVAALGLAWQQKAEWPRRCRSAFAAAILLNLLGCAGAWCAGQGLLPVPWAALGWFGWFPAAAAFALAPAWDGERGRVGHWGERVGCEA
jgi:hypothetical protein